MKETLESFEADNLSSLTSEIEYFAEKFDKKVLFISLVFCPNVIGERYGAIVNFGENE